MKITIKPKNTKQIAQKVALDEKLKNACEGKSAGKNGLNIKDFRRALKNSFPEATVAIDKATTRKEVEALCSQLIDNQKDVAKVVPQKKEEYYELPKEYCEDYTLDELTEKAGKGVKLSSVDRYKICTELGLPKYESIMQESLGYPRAKILAIANKIEANKALNMEEKRIVEQWNRAHDPIKQKLDDLSRKFISGQRLTELEMKYFDRELFNKYCRCTLKRKKKDAELFADRNLDKVLEKLPDQSMDKANAIVAEGLKGKNWEDLSEVDQDKVLAELMKIYLGLSIGGCKSSVYMKTRKIKPRNRECDYELGQAEIFLEN